MNSNEKKSENKQVRKSLKKVTVRYDEKVLETIDALADEYGISRSDIVRLATDSTLERYLDTIRYVDAKQALTINKNICALGNVLIEIKSEIRRIGINLNQIARAVNCGSIPQISKYDMSRYLQDLDSLVSREEAAIANAGEALNVF